MVYIDIYTGNYFSILNTLPLTSYLVNSYIYYELEGIIWAATSLIE